jgi:SAM-dependent methyltransferase
MKSLNLSRNNRKKTYEPTGSQEEFIVPLLKSQIHALLSDYGKSQATRPTVLDVGCGCQPFRNDLELLGFNYVSADVQQNAERVVDILCRIDHQLPLNLLKIAPFEFIFCTEVMEHVADWDIAFSNFYQLLAPSGRLLITCPYFYPLHEEPHDYWRPTPHAFKYFGEKYGLKILHQVSAGDAWDVLGTLLASSHPIPVTRSLKDRLITKLVHKSQQFLFQILKSRYLQTATRMTGKSYLSNIVVFGK